MLREDRRVAFLTDGAWPWRWERDAGRCADCGAGFDLQYDHVIPHSLGGASTEANLQLLCGDCNREKGARL